MARFYIGLLMSIVFLVLILFGLGYPTQEQVLPTYVPTLTSRPFDGQGTWDAGRVITRQFYAAIGTQSSIAATETITARGSATLALPQGIEWVDTNTPGGLE